MKCSNCGFEIPEGKLYCPVCGTEVQLVPDYTSVGLEREKLLRQRAEEEQKRREAEEAEARKNRVSPLILLVRTALILLIAAGLSFLMIHYVMEHERSNFGYLKAQAEEAENEGHLEEALSMAELALEVRPYSTDMAVLKADLLYKNGEPAKAEQILWEVIEHDPDELVAYEALIRILISEGSNSEVAELVSESRFESLTEKYGDYLSDPPTFSLVNGDTYPLGTSLEILSQAGTVYYTTDGSDPLSRGILYTTPIQLPLGTSRIAACAVNEKGVASKVVQAVYNIRKAG